MLVDECGMAAMVHLDDDDAARARPGTARPLALQSDRRNMVRLGVLVDAMERRCRCERKLRRTTGVDQKKRVAMGPLNRN